MQKIVKVGLVASLLCSTQLGLLQARAEEHAPVKKELRAGYSEASVSVENKVGTQVDQEWEDVTYRVVEDKAIITGLSQQGANTSDLALTIPATIDGLPVTEIGDGAFGAYPGPKYSNLKQVDFSQATNLKKIGASAFDSCDNLSGELNLPAGLTHIGEGAFWGCKGFSGELNLPAGLTHIGEGAFWDCKGFSGELNLPAGLTHIGECAFLSCDRFSGNLKLPASLTSIGKYAFADCSGFSGNLKLPASLTSIGWSAFYNCSGLSGEVVIPSGVSTISANVFHGTSISAVQFVEPSQLTSFTGNLQSYSNLKTVAFPQSLTDLTGEPVPAMFNTSSITTLIFTNPTAPTLTDNPFVNIENSGTLYYPRDATTYNQGSFGTPQLDHWDFEEFDPVTDLTDLPERLTAGVPVTIEEKIESADPSTKAVNYELLDAPVGVSYDPATKRLSASQAGTFKMRAKVTDSTVTDHETGTTPQVIYVKDFTVTVEPKPAPTFRAVTSITALPTKMTAGETLKLTGKVNPSNATNKKLTWKLAAQQAGVTLVGDQLTAEQAGEVKLQAIVKQGTSQTTDFVQDFTVKVDPAAVKYTMNFTTDGNGKLVGETKLEVTENELLPGDKIPTPQANEGYIFSRWVDETGATIANFAEIKVTKDTTYRAIFRKVAQPVKTEVLHRLYNPNSGEHFYTLSTPEKDHLVTQGWQYEGVLGSAAEKGEAVYRLYNPNVGDHHYTTSAQERDHLASLGWQTEGTAFASGGEQDVFRLYNPNAVAGAHHYTQHATERDQLANVGWHTEGTGFQLY
ncbi:leucine-rich repeat protein [Enterococcus sp. CSURQ0835]|uniref:leucine-rich repeat protein n=1 Tax=Enterococcus sp. CSURQ0835 TaxID=2681394 RepID=UPI0013593824|nr:leucine-rich repeat protein [Enterococcus sp. CSURQ0835]